jgi:Ala-tRNA(Pro) deacylase
MTMSITEYLRKSGVPFKRMLHGPASSATRVARSLHVRGATVAKGVLLVNEQTEGFVLTVLPATHRIDLDLLRPILQSSEVRLATEAELERVFHDCELGAVPPFGASYGIPTLVDASLSGETEIFVETNWRHEGVQIAFHDFMGLEKPLLARFATPTTPSPNSRPTRRRAG